MSSLPPLPEILDKAIETKAFSHKSLFSRLNGLVEDPEENQDNERLVWLGRAAMNAAVSKLLFQTFPRHRIIYLAELRGRILKAEQLTLWSNSYNLASRALIHRTSEHARHSAGVQSGLFEAYVGAVYLDSGPMAVESWIIPLVKFTYPNDLISPPPPPPVPTTNTGPVKKRSADAMLGGEPDTAHYPKLKREAEDDVSMASLSSPVPSLPSALPRPAVPKAEPIAAPGSSALSMNYLALFNQMTIQKRDMAVQWDISSSGPPHTPAWLAKVIVRGEEIGVGTGGSKQAAREEAARKALLSMGWQAPMKIE